MGPPNYLFIFRPETQQWGKEGEKILLYFFVLSFGNHQYNINLGGKKHKETNKWARIYKRGKKVGSFFFPKERAPQFMSKKAIFLVKKGGKGGS